MDQGHRHAGKSSRDFLDAHEVLKKLGLASGEVVLDAGCGTGYFSMAAASFVGGAGMVWALDADQPSLDSLSREIFTRSIKNLRPLLADLTQPLPVRTESVDLCMMVNVLHGLAWDGAAAAAMAELARVLKPGGRFAVVEFKKEEMVVGPPLEVRLTPEEVEKLARPAGFRKERAFDAGPYSYAVLFRK